MADTQELLVQQIKEQGELVRKLKAAKESSEKVILKVLICYLVHSYEVKTITCNIASCLRLFNMSFHLFCRTVCPRRAESSMISLKLTRIFHDTVTYAALDLAIAMLRLPKVCLI